MSNVAFVLQLIIDNMMRKVYAKKKVMYTSTFALGITLNRTDNPADIRKGVQDMKKLISLLLAVIMIFSLAACSPGGDDTSPSEAVSEEPSTEAVSPSEETTPANETGKIGIAMPTKSLERWNRDGSYLQEKFEAAGYEVSLVFSDNDVTQQVNDLENLIADGVDLLVIAAIDGESLTNVLDSADEAGIYVIAYDRLIMNTKAVDYYVSFDNYTVGTLQGEYVAEALGLDVSDTSTSYNIEFTAGDAADNNAGFFFNGAYDTLEPYIEAGILNIASGQDTFEKVATEQWSTDNALARMQNILASYYSDGTVLDVALCSNDSTALGVSQAIQSDYAGSNQPIITGQDGDEANLANIIDGLQSMTVYKAVANEAVVTIDLAIALLKGETPDKGLISASNWDFDIAYDVESYDNNTGIIPSYLLVPSVVTKDNIQKELVDTGYYEMDGDYPKAIG